MPCLTKNRISIANLHAFEYLGLICTGVPFVSSRQIIVTDEPSQYDLALEIAAFGSDTELSKFPLMAEFRKLPKYKLFFEIIQSEKFENNLWVNPTDVGQNMTDNYVLAIILYNPFLNAIKYIFGLQSFPNFIQRNKLDPEATEHQKRSSDPTEISGIHSCDAQNYTGPCEV